MKTRILIPNVPVELRRRYKSYCASQDISMSADLRQHMEDVSTAANILPAQDLAEVED